MEEVFASLSWTQLLVSLSLAFYTLKMQNYELVKNLWIIPHHLNPARMTQLVIEYSSESSDNCDDFIGGGCTDIESLSDPVNKLL